MLSFYSDITFASTSDKKHVSLGYSALFDNFKERHGPHRGLRDMSLASLSDYNDGGGAST